MLVGSVDMIGSTQVNGTYYGYGEVTGTFSGSDSYWFGDEQSWQNTKLQDSENASDAERKALDKLHSDHL